MFKKSKGIILTLAFLFGILFVINFALASPVIENLENGSTSTYGTWSNPAGSQFVQNNPAYCAPGPAQCSNPFGLYSLNGCACSLNHFLQFPWPYSEDGSQSNTFTFNESFNHGSISFYTQIAWWQFGSTTPVEIGFNGNSQVKIFYQNNPLGVFDIYCQGTGDPIKIGMIDHQLQWFQIGLKYLGGDIADCYLNGIKGGSVSVSPNSSFNSLKFNNSAIYDVDDISADIYPSNLTISDLQQYSSNGLTEISENEATNQNTFVFKGVLESPVGANVRLQVEVQPSAEPFTDTPTAIGDFVQTENIASAVIPNLPDGSYHWQARGIDAEGNVSAWQIASNQTFTVTGSRPTNETFIENLESSPISASGVWSNPSGNQFTQNSSCGTGPAYCSNPSNTYDYSGCACSLDRFFQYQSPHSDKGDVSNTFIFNYPITNGSIGFYTRLNWWQFGSTAPVDIGFAGNSIVKISYQNNPLGIFDVYCQGTGEPVKIGIIEHQYQWFQINIKYDGANTADCYLNGTKGGTVSVPQNSLFNSLKFNNTAVYDIDDISEGFGEQTINISSVLFLPGIEGSRLYKPDYDGGTTKLWEPDGSSQVENLSLNYYGVPDRVDIYTRDVIDHAYIPFGWGDVYKSFLDQLETMKNTEYLINDYSVVPYDWRLFISDLVNNGNKLSDGRIYYSGALAQTSTPYIIKELRRLAAKSKTGKVTIVAHSMGGFVTKALTDKLGDEASTLIDKIIFVAVPQIGTPKAIGGLLHGFDMALPKSYLSVFGISNSTIRELGQNMPSAYSLLPSSSYFSSVNDSVITFDSSSMLSPWREKYGLVVSSTEAMRNFLIDQSREILPTENDINSPPVLNEFLLNKAEEFHGALDNWAPPAGVELTEIAGWGYDTIKTVEYYQGQDLHCGSLWPSSFIYCVPVESLKYRPKMVLDGDGTVLAPSALWIPESASVKRYFVDLKSYNKQFFTIGRSHLNILEVPQLRTFIKDIITNSTKPLPEFISNSAPQNSNPETQLHFILHSPLSLDLYDDQGNHTGLSSTTNIIEENIPGSNYQEFGEVKYISAPASTTLHLVMKGYDNGSFTLDVNEVRGDKTISSTTFAAVPVLVGAIATLNIPKDGGVADISPLLVDEDGDGTPEITLESKPGEVVIPDFVPPVTTASVSGVYGLNGWYTSDALISLVATDNDTGVKQTLYSLDNGTSYSLYTESFTVSTEGVVNMLYYSIDNQGNKEEVKTFPVKIDKTAPEPKISIDPPTKDLKVEGFDNLSQATTSKSSNVYIVADEAGNTVKLFFQKTFTGKFLTLAKLIGVQYNADPIINLPDSYFVYLWNPLTNIVLSQTIAVNKIYAIEAVYNNKKNQTTVLLKEKGLTIQKQIFTGFHASKLIINKGIIGYEL